jgi:hypothetical protein
LKDFQDSGLSLKPGELIADTEMSTRTKCEVRIFCIVALCIGYVVSTLEGYQGLGHGYFLLFRTYRIKNGFEGIYHSHELYFHWRNLGQTGQYFISPSGKYALYAR